jgi:hypothetical protein
LADALVSLEQLIIVRRARLLNSRQMVQLPATNGEENA